ncbi:MAG: hypothetical protein WA066_00995 [Candidatus Omnitrophota bacterium]
MLITIFLSCINILTGIFLMLILSFMQGPLLGIVMGGAFIALNFCRFSKKLYDRIIYFLIMPLIVLFSVNVIMMGIDSNIPSGFKTPIPVGLIILLPIWAVIFSNLYFSKMICDKFGNSSHNSIWTRSIGISILILGIACIGLGIFSLPLSISRYAKGPPLRFWFSSAVIFSGLLKMQIVKDLLKQNLRYISFGLLFIGLLDALIGYAFLYQISKIAINLYLMIFFVIPAVYFLKFIPRSK